MTLKPKTKYDVLVRNGTERFLVVPEKDFNTMREVMREKLQDEADFRAIERSTKRNAGKPTYTLEQIKRDLRMIRPKRKRKG
jgi:hypothetical protein